MIRLHFCFLAVALSVMYMGGLPLSPVVMRAFVGSFGKQRALFLLGVFVVLKCLFFIFIFIFVKEPVGCGYLMVL